MRAAERAWERTPQEPRPSFEVVPGGGLDARARQGVSPTFLRRFGMVVAVAAFLIAINLVRVAISAATVSVLQTNAELSAQISEAETLSSNLKIERSVLSSNARISRIATQNYGMVLPTQRVSIDLGAQAETGDQDAASRGDAAQSEAQTGEQSNVG